MTLGGWRERLGSLSVRRAELDDKELVTAASGDLRSYEELVGRYERLVGRVIYPYARRRSPSKTSCRRVFARLRRLETFNPDYRFKTWLLAIANNLGVDTLGADGRSWSSTPRPTRPLPQPRGRGRRRRPSRGVREAIATLPETYGVPLILRYTEGLSYAEIAEVLPSPCPRSRAGSSAPATCCPGRLEESGERE